MSRKLRNFTLEKSTYLGHPCLTLYWCRKCPSKAINLVFEIFTKHLFSKSRVLPANIAPYTARLATFLDYLETGYEILKSRDDSSTVILHCLYYDYLMEGAMGADLLAKSIAKENGHKAVSERCAQQYMAPVKRLLHSSHSYLDPVKNNFPFEPIWSIETSLRQLESLANCCIANECLYSSNERDNTQLELDFELKGEQYSKSESRQNEFYDSNYIFDKIFNTEKPEALLWALIATASQHRKDTIPYLIDEILWKIVPL
ncbi:hypothetical protein [Pseudomonas aeruginosa]|uniref:hypothetical protein n=1 Tax=Pseudomonas aeruginosa TaxID=287 RepID=UPI001114AC6C|nr:hypothetical protein [Pseudomonas aeruginosa]MCT5519302.1 hypothetical protein [Pseudomonas aeruginosa]MEE2515658.1 hypothetical protein [Pseudomonas aeruginosa]HEJ1327438.1 hypothetical protein [Pseudomonas aeruginosa]